MAPAPNQSRTLSSTVRTSLTVGLHLISALLFLVALTPAALWLSEAFTRSAATELGPLGITVTAVAPGPVQTGWLTPELEEQVRRAIPLGRIGTPEEIAAGAVADRAGGQGLGRARDQSSCSLRRTQLPGTDFILSVST